jgi:hypothetical protein
MSDDFRAGQQDIIKRLMGGLMARLDRYKAELQMLPADDIQQLYASNSRSELGAKLTKHNTTARTYELWQIICRLQELTKE